MSEKVGKVSDKADIQSMIEYLADTFNWMINMTFLLQTSLFYIDII